MTKTFILLLVLFVYQASTMDIDQYFFPKALPVITTKQTITSSTPNLGLSSLASSIIANNLQTTTTTLLKQNTTNTPNTNSSPSQSSIINTGLPGGLTTAGFLATCLSRIVQQAIFKMPQLVKLAQNGFISLESQKINDTSYIITYDGANFDAMVKGRCVESSNQVVIQLVRYNEY